MYKRQVYWGLETLQAGYAVIEFEAADEAPLKRIAAKFPRIQSPPSRPHPHVVLGFDLLANRLVSPLTDPMRHLDRVITDPVELAVLPDRYGSFLEPRLTWSFMYRHPAHPDRSRRYVVLAVPPGVSPAPFVRPILEEAGREGLTVLSSMLGEVGIASPYPTPFTELLKRVTEAWYPGTPFGPLPTAGGYTTSILLRERGIATYGFQPIAMNIADSARRHGNDERVFLRDYLNGVNLLSDIVEEFALFTPAGPSD